MLTESLSGGVLRCCDGFFLRTFAGRAVRPSPECRTSSSTTSSPPRFDGEPPRSRQAREEQAAMAPRHSHAGGLARVEACSLVSHPCHIIGWPGSVPITVRLAVCNRGNPGITMLVDGPQQGHPGATSILVRSP